MSESIRTHEVQFSSNLGYSGSKLLKWITGTQDSNTGIRMRRNYKHRHEYKLPSCLGTLCCRAGARFAGKSRGTHLGLCSRSHPSRRVQRPGWQCGVPFWACGGSASASGTHGRKGSRRCSSRPYGGTAWALVKGFKRSYHNMETILFTIDLYYGNLN